MAFSLKPFLICTIFTLLFSLHTHARDAQLFNKVSNTNVILDSQNDQQQQEQQPDFHTDNENGYGLQDPKHDQLPSPHKHLPKNYNPVAYVTQPDDVSDNTAFMQENSFTSDPDNSNYYNDASNNNDDQQQEHEYISYTDTRKKRRNNNNYYYGGGSSFNSQPHGMATATHWENDFNHIESGKYQPQGMSDTRSLENGKYYYDINTMKYNSKHPYERLRNSPARNEYRNMKYYGDSEFDKVNSMGGYHNQNEFRDEDTYEEMP